MKMDRKGQKIKLWGNHIDPEVSAETYLESTDEAAASWAKEHENLLAELNRDTINLYRRHMDNCDLRSLDAKPDKTKPIKKLSPKKSKKGKVVRKPMITQPTDPSERWLDRLHAGAAEDLHELMTEPALVEGIQTLTPRQRQVVHMSIVRKMKNSDIAKVLQTTDRNVRDILSRAYGDIRRILSDKRGEGTIIDTIYVLCSMLLPTFVVSWVLVDRILYPKLKKAILRQTA